jgi:hypothetical protein
LITTENDNSFYRITVSQAAALKLPRVFAAKAVVLGQFIAYS